jgi:polyferredoxin
MMEAVNLPKGLIRYTSEEQIETRAPFKFSFRAKAYSVILIALLGVVTTLILLRGEIEANILRTPGMLYQMQDDGNISNLYNFKIINKGSNDLSLEIRPLEGEFNLEMIGRQPELQSQQITEGAFFLSAPKTSFEYGKAETTLGIFDSEGRLLDRVKISITGPL